MTMRETEDGDIHRHGLVLSSKIPHVFRKDFKDRKETKGRLRYIASAFRRSVIVNSLGQDAQAT
jgi:hypothetical protein